MSGKQAFTGEPAAFLVEWMRDTERAASEQLDGLEKSLRSDLKRSDEALIKMIQKEVATKVQVVEEAARARLTEAQAAEREAQEALGKARQFVADAELRLRESITVNLAGSPGPAATGRPLGELLRSRFTRVSRFKETPPEDAWYVVTGMAFGTGRGRGTRLQPALTPAEADTYADSVVAAVVGVVDETLDSLAVVHACSLYGSMARGRAVAESQKAYVKTWLTPVTRLAATEYCRHTWAGEAAEGTTLGDWLRGSKSFTLVTRKARTWVLDMSRGVDVASWTERSEEVFQQLEAAGIEVHRGRRNRAKGDADAHGDGFHLASELLAKTPTRVAVVVEGGERGGSADSASEPAVR